MLRGLRLDIYRQLPANTCHYTNPCEGRDPASQIRVLILVSQLIIWRLPLPARKSVMYH